MVPYIKGIKPTPEEIADFIVDTYARCQRIVFDARVSGNLKKTSTGQIVCLDIGLAIEVDPEAKSQTSLQYKATNMEDRLLWIDNFKHKHPLEANTLKALIFLQEKFPEIKGDTILKLKADPNFTAQLAHYCEQWRNYPIKDFDKKPVYSFFGLQLKEDETKVPAQNKTPQQALFDSFLKTFPNARQDEIDNAQNALTDPVNQPALDKFNTVLIDLGY